MKRFFWNLAAWNLGGFLAITLLGGMIFFHSRHGTWPDRENLVGISSALLLRLGLYLAMLLGITLLGAWQGMRKLMAPIKALNHQLEQIGPTNLDRRVAVQNTEETLHALQEHINNLLSGTHLALIQLKQYAAQVAHELRAPLTLIRLKIEQAADKIDPALGEEIQRELLRLNLHVEQALFVARAEQGHLTLNRTRFDLAALLRDVVEDFRLLAEEEGRELSYTAASVPIYADAKYLRQILYGLLTNALRHGCGPLRVHLLDSGTLQITNRSKPPSPDESDLGLGRRIISALIGLHGDITLRSRRWKNSYSVQLGFEILP